MAGETGSAAETGSVDPGNADCTAAIQGSPAAEPASYPGLFTYSGSGSASDPTTGTCTCTEAALTTQVRAAVKAGATTKTGFTAEPGFATHTNTGAITETETSLGAQTGVSP